MKDWIPDISSYDISSRVGRPVFIEILQLGPVRRPSLFQSTVRLRFLVKNKVGLMIYQLPRITCISSYICYPEEKVQSAFSSHVNNGKRTINISHRLLPRVACKVPFVQTCKFANLSKFLLCILQSDYALMGALDPSFTR